VISNCSEGAEPKRRDRKAEDEGRWIEKKEAKDERQSDNLKAKGEECTRKWLRRGMNGLGLKGLPTLTTGERGRERKAYAYAVVRESAAR